MSETSLADIDSVAAFFRPRATRPASVPSATVASPRFNHRVIFSEGAELARNVTRRPASSAGSRRRIARPFFCARVRFFLSRFFFFFLLIYFHLSPQPGIVRSTLTNSDRAVIAGRRVPPPLPADARTHTARTAQSPPHPPAPYTQLPWTQGSQPARRSGPFSCVLTHLTPGTVSPNERQKKHLQLFTFLSRRPN